MLMVPQFLFISARICNATTKFLECLILQMNSSFICVNQFSTISPYAFDFILIYVDPVLVVRIILQQLLDSCLGLLNLIFIRERTIVCLVYSSKFLAVLRSKVNVTSPLAIPCVISKMSLLGC